MIERSCSPPSNYQVWLLRCCLSVVWWQLATWHLSAAAAGVPCTAHGTEQAVLIRYQADGSAPDVASRKGLDAAVRQAQRHSDIRLAIEGFADNGNYSHEFALALGDKYAQAVKQAFLNAAVAPERISLLSLGKNGALPSGQGVCIRWQHNLTFNPQGASE